MKLKCLCVALHLMVQQGNISMTTRLGCNFSLQNLTTFFTFKYFKIHVFYDPCHMIKFIRNTFGDYLILLNDKGEEINFILSAGIIKVTR